MVSFRLGGPDGVSVQAATWGRALERLGYSLRRVAGELSDGLRPGDVVVSGLAVAAEAAPGPAGQRPAAPEGPSPDELRTALNGSDVVVVENMLSLPLHLEAARVLTACWPTCLRRSGCCSTITTSPGSDRRPPRSPSCRPGSPEPSTSRSTTSPGGSWRSGASKRSPSGTHSISTFCRACGRRRARHSAWRRDDVLVLQPTRAIARKNIPAALRLSEGLAARLQRPVRYWLPGPAEDGYAATLAEVLAATTVPVLRTHPGALGLEMADAYAACDLVVFPSTGGEGFGQPVIESVWADRPLAVLSYPALDEILALGFSFLPADDPDAVASAILQPDAATMARNRELAAAHFSMAALERSLEALLRTR